MKNIFLSENIEYFSVLPADSAEIINSRLMPEGAKSIVVFLVPYRTSREKAKHMAHFSLVRDYHGFSSSLFDRVIPKLKSLFPENDFHGFADHSPVNERKLADIGGLGKIGKNGLLLNEKYGSYVFIGEIITDAVLPSFVLEAKGLCSCCGKCLSVCPQKGVCISAISQKKRKTSEDLEILRETETIWGCDRCAEVCPVNESAELSPISYFYEKKINSPTDILQMDDETFKSYPFAYRGRKVIEENIENIFGKHID